MLINLLIDFVHNVFIYMTDACNKLRDRNLLQYTQYYLIHNSDQIKLTKKFYKMRWLID
jgi:hypothetical protein